MAALEPGLGHNGAPELWEPQPGPQSLAVAAQFVTELMFGGARGGGKSDFLLGDFLQDIGLGALWRGIIFRRSHPELEELIVRAKEIFAPYGAVWQVQARTFVFPSGAFLRMRHLDTEADCDNYQGHQYTWIGWDELTNWPDLKPYRKLKACLRSAHGVKYKRIRSSANPGGRGHHAVKSYFIDPCSTGNELITNIDEDGYETTKMYIPSKVRDNKKLMKNDPGYVSRLRETGSPELVRAWLDGDWTIIMGAYFPEFSVEKHVLKPFKVPNHWLRFRSMDWGSATPFCVLWHAVCSEGFQYSPDQWLPAGSIITYREMYGWTGEPNVGVRWPATRVAQHIKKAEAGDNVVYGVLDKSAFSNQSGPSHAERMAGEGVRFRPSDSNRIGGWDMVRDRLCGLDGDPDKNYGVGTPMWYVFDNCKNIIRTLPALQHDLVDAEDCNTDGEDHAPDTLRYGFMSRPWKRPKPISEMEKEVKLLQDATMNDLWDAMEDRD